MNQIERDFFELLDMTHQVRDLVLDLVGEADMAAALPGCPELRSVIQAMGDVEHSYTESFRSFVQDFSVSAPGREGVTSGESAKSWFAALDTQLKESLSALSDEDTSKMIDRGGWQIPALANFHTYREAVLILFGKMDCYLKSLNKDLPEMWVQWVG